MLLLSVTDSLDFSSLFSFVSSIRLPNQSLLLLMIGLLGELILFF